MSEQNKHDEVTHLEGVLKELAPATPEFNRDRLMYCAGQASMRRRLFTLPAASAVLGLLVGVLGCVVVLQMTYQPAKPQVVYVVKIKEQPPPQKTPQQPVQPPPTQAPSPEPTELVQTDDLSATRLGGYVGLRNRVIRWGADVLPSPPMGESSNETSPPTMMQLWDEFAGSEANDGQE